MYEHEWLDAFRASPVSVKIVWGQQDSVATPIIARALLEYRPDAELIELAGAGRYPQLEAPEIVVREIKIFFVEQPKLELTSSIV
jgi:pimeloyl-ACP methyl ester carboxylesterase